MSNHYSTRSKRVLEPPRKKKRNEDKSQQEEEEDEEEVLEREMVKKYLEVGRQRNTYKNGDVSMIVYRMYLFHHKRGDNRMSHTWGDINTMNLRTRTVVKPRPKTEPLTLKDLDRYWGRIDFGVEHDKSYVLSSSRRRFPYLRKSDAQMTFFCDNNLVSTPHCEITRPSHADDFIWIKDLDSDHGTFVNGRRIPVNERYKLVDGDVIGLGIPHDCSDPRVDVKHKRFCIFKVKGLKRNELENEVKATERLNGGNAAFCALNNVLILDKIIRYLKHKDLKTARLVNRFWKNRADLRLFPRSVLKFEYTYHPRVTPLSGVRWSDVFQDKVSMIRNYNLANWEIDLTSNNPIAAPRQFYTDVYWLLNHMSLLVRDMTLSMSIVHDRKGEEFAKIFSKLKNLETLDLSLDISTAFYPTFQTNPTTFPTVKHLILWIHDVEGEDDLTETLKNHLVLEIAKLFPNIQNIMAKTGLLQSVLRCIHTHRLWSGLKEISAEFELYGDGEDENPAVSFTMISTLPQKPIRLQLDDIPRLNTSTVGPFENMLRSLAGTLEHLALRFTDTNMRAEGEEKPILRLPRFPKLKTLELVVFVDEDDDYDMQMQIIFPSGGICYEKDLPEIRTLQLLPSESLSDCESEWGEAASNVEAIFDIFVPKDSNTVCHSMRWVEFGLEKEKCRKNNPWYKDFLQRFRRVFPHVYHPDVMKGIKLLSIEEQEPA